jgi:hypothetical protein
MSTNIDIRTKVISLVSDEASRLSLYTTTEWRANTDYQVGERIHPTIYKSRTFKCTTSGTSGTNEPTWIEVSGATVSDNTVIWMEDSDDYDRHILGGLDIFSKDYPYIVGASIQGNGTQIYATPSGWVNEFSTISAIEYPVDKIPPIYLLNDRYELIRTSTGTWKIFLKDNAPASTETFNVFFTAKRDATNIPSGYIEAFCWLTAALACTELATKYVNSVDPSINADSSNPFDISSGYADRAAIYMSMYKNYMGISNDKAVPSLYITQRVSTYPYGITRLTHPRIERNSRTT